MRILIVLLSIFMIQPLLSNAELTNESAKRFVNFQLIPIENKLYLSLYKIKNADYHFLYEYENKEFKRLAQNQYPDAYIKLHANHNEIEIGLKKIPTVSMNYFQVEKCQLKMRTRKYVAQGTLTCNFWGTDQSIDISLQNNAIGKYTPPDISYTNMVFGERYYIGLSINDHYSPTGLAYVIFEKGTSPVFIDKPPDCSQGFAFDRYAYQDVTLCMYEYGWKIVENNHVRDFPSPLSELHSILYFKDHIWGGYFDLCDEILTICRFSKDLSKSLDIFMFKAEKEEIYPLRGELSKKPQVLSQKSIRVEHMPAPSSIILNTEVPPIQLEIQPNPKTSQHIYEEIIIPKQENPDKKSVK